MSAPSVLYDAPGPRTRAFNLAASLVGLALLLWLAWIVYTKFDQTGQWDGEKWRPFIEDSGLWTNLILPGVVGTLKAFALGSVLALALGAVLGVGRMSQNRAIRWASAAVVEFFRSIPLLILMMFLYYLPPVLGLDSNVYLAVVGGLMLYNGSVLAEVIRAGVGSLPKGQREAGMAVGLTPSQTMNLILLPQAVRAMLPAIVAQLVVVLKDTALGYILAYDELLNQIPKIDGNFHNLIPAAIVVAALFITMNLSLATFATWLEKALTRSHHTAAAVAEHEAILNLPGAGMPGGGGVGPV